MKSIVCIIVLLLSLDSFAQLSIGNSHKVDAEGSIYRGREPKKLVDQLTEIGITDVIIFKNDVRGEVAKEVSSLEALEITPHHIPFHWKDYPSMAQACEQMIDALQVMHQVRENGGKVFFHCTAGEDRTGALAGLFLMLDEGLNRDTVFKEEMCQRGYSDGNSHKPYYVTHAIEKELTPLFVAMARQVQRGYLSFDRLNKGICKDLKVYPTQLKCR